MKALITLAMFVAPCTVWPTFFGDAHRDAHLQAYTNQCTFAVGDDVINHIWYNDRDGDCRTRDWYLEIVLPDGRVFIARSSDERRPLEWDLTGKQACCVIC